MQNRQWTDKEGNKRTSAEIIAERAYFGGSKQRDKNDSSGGQRDYGAQHDDGYDEPGYTADPAQGNGYGSYSPFDN